MFHHYYVDGISSVRTIRFHPLAGGCSVASRVSSRTPRDFKFRGFRRGLLSAPGSGGEHRHSQVMELLHWQILWCWIAGVGNSKTFVLQLFYSLHATKRCALLGYVAER